MVPRPSLSPAALLESPLTRDREAGSMQRQLHDRLKRAILDGSLAPGSRLPGSRALAESLEISRNTVTATYEHLAAEGYVQPDRQGTRVTELSSPTLPPQRAGKATAVPDTARRLSKIKPAVSRAETDVALRPGVPALSHFPAAAWRRSLDRAIRGAGPAALGYGDPLGEPPLRAAIARHLSVARGVRCEPHQVVIAEGAQEAISLCVRLLSNPGETGWVEDPGYRGVKAAMHAGDMRIVPLRVDAEGLCVSERDWQKHPPRLIYTTPSHQYPGGAVLGIARRLALIAQARQHGAWIIEDDYDSEFHYAGKPTACVQGLDPHERTVYIGTFTKSLFPGLRIGYMLLPPALVEPMTVARTLLDGHSAPVPQLTLARFIEGGHFGAHVRAMRQLYGERRDLLARLVGRHLGGYLQPRVPAGGMQMPCLLARAIPEARAVDAARRAGIDLLGLGGLYAGKADQSGFLMGFAAHAPDELEAAVRTLAGVLRGLER